jgi:hypothetical protein
MVSPAAMYGWSTALFFGVFLLIPFIGYLTGEQLSVTLTLLSLKCFLLLLLVISILTSIVFWGWFKRNWYINLLVFVCAGLVLVRLYYTGKLL